MLAWAREDAGYTLDSASERTKFSPDRLTSWEVGEAKPTIPQLRTLANVYHRPLAASFMPDPPEGFQPIEDFRRLPDAEEQRWSPALRALVRPTRAQQRIYAELLADLGEQQLELPAPPDPNDADVTGAFARAAERIDSAHSE
jgi:transcriptional regulator with XRE-family HTH domain